MESKQVAQVNIKKRLKQMGVLFAFILLAILVSYAAPAQSRYSRHKTQYFKARYRAQIQRTENACHLLKKKRAEQHNIRVVAHKSRKVKFPPMAEVDPPGFVRAEPPTQPQVVLASNEPVTESLPNFDEQEDAVLIENHLPTPSSEKHAEIRKHVEEHLKTKKDGEPIALSPLYFDFDKADVSIEEMEPFLLAVEYALQGRMVLIEGHTDPKGSSAYNLQLSMKRVQKIRNIMHQMGVPDERISVLGYGEEVASANAKSATDINAHRRVDIRVF
jgi:outer membrane protein OmpA-like peptidoglycan-associated protein